MISPALLIVPAVAVNGAERRSESMASRLIVPPPKVNAAPVIVAAASHAAGDDTAGVHIDDRRIRLPRLLHVERRAFAEIQRAAVRIGGLVRDAVDRERVVAADADDRGNVIEVDAHIHVRQVDGQRRRGRCRRDRPANSTSPRASRRSASSAPCPPPRRRSN